MHALSESFSASPAVLSISPRLCTSTHPRHLAGVLPYEAVVLVRFDESGEPMIFDGYEVGPSGLFLRSDFLLDEGDELWLTFPSPKGHPVNARGRITDVFFGAADGGAADGGAADGEPGDAGMRVDFSEISSPEWSSLFV